MGKPDLPGGFVSALQSLTRWLEVEEIPYSTIGGVAVSLIAQPRATQDIDAVIWLEEKRWEAFLLSGQQHGFVPRINEALAFARKSRVLLLKHRGSEISIDISFGALEFERQMIERATALKIGAINLKVPTPEDLIITKAVALRPKDIADMEAIVNAEKNLDVRRIRHWVKEFADALEMPEIQENVERVLRHRK